MDYDFERETRRLVFPDIVVGTKRINRGTAKAHVDPGFSWSISSEQRDLIYSSLIQSTLRGGAPNIDLSDPISGHYIYNKHGILFDGYLGVAQRLIDENHPNFRKMIASLVSGHALLRREAATNEFITNSNGDLLIRTPSDFAILIENLANKEFLKGPYRAFFSSSGSEAVEAAIKLACRHKYISLKSRYGTPIIDRLMDVLGVEIERDYRHLKDNDPVYSDYPFVFFAPLEAFHGRTLGALALTDVRPVQKRGFPNSFKVARFSFRGELNDIQSQVWDVSLINALERPDELIRNMLEGRYPRDLIAGFVLEPVQGEGGYNFPNNNFLSNVSEYFSNLGVLTIADEVQTFARTGSVFACKHYGINPDIIATSKPTVVGITLATEEITSSLELGWHSNTWGGGRIFEINYGFTAIDTFLHYQDDNFFGNTYLENTKIKEYYINRKFEELSDKYPSIIRSYRGRGVMWAFEVINRDKFVKIAQICGMKLLTVGVTANISAIRLLFLTDVLAKEIDCCFRILDMACAKASKDAEN
uniref:Acetylornithine/succinyldiaminopimelate/putrescine aminotransferase n=1 Tax=Candidatus Kentrum sp. FW TaxID=2126338 RepID=A0A450THR2_9GAMM|nr:MAG: Acetylornithine/succinyldiaminopimelate/putrescine aminotransferase [Candidatus Kentron sp. FW]